ncbi:MAG TPA: hypothetical protein VMY42_28205 [Thermoguttaceae bacterium]|nr:hypothetical protein [Thermoguttaceae bacterium]
MIRKIISCLWYWGGDFLSFCQNPTGCMKREMEIDRREEKWNKIVKELEIWRKEEEKRVRFVKNDRFEYWIDEDNKFWKSEIVRL